MFLQDTQDTNYYDTGHGDVQFSQKGKLALTFVRVTMWKDVMLNVTLNLIQGQLSYPTKKADADFRQHDGGAVTVRVTAVGTTRGLSRP